MGFAFSLSLLNARVAFCSASGIIFASFNPFFFLVNVCMAL